MALLSEEIKRHEEYLRAIKNKQYKHAEEVWHRLHQGTYIGDLVYGANDGIITTFAVVSGATGAELSSWIIIVLGLANLVADGLSMASSKFLSVSSERAFYNSQRKREEWEIEQFPEIEKEEVRDILRRWGIAKERIEYVLEDIIQDKKNWLDLMMREELDLHESGSTKPFKHGLATFFAFATAGFIPLIPYIFGFPSQFQLQVSIVTTGFSLFLIGAARTFVTAASWLVSGLEMLFIGGGAASVAYLIGWAMKTFFGIAGI